MFESHQQPPLTHLLGIGLYSVAEAARLAQVPKSTVREWVCGRGGRPPRRPATGPVIDGQPTITFLDLIDLKIVHAFRKAGVTWPVIMTVAEEASKEYDTPHPFAANRFRTDGQRLYESFRSTLFDRISKNYAFEEIVEQSLYDGLTFEHDMPKYWTVPGYDSLIIIDPQRSFGKPIAARCGVPTHTLAMTADAEDSVAFAASLFNASEDEVWASLRYRDDLAKAA